MDIDAIIASAAAPVEAQAVEAKIETESKTPEVESTEPIEVEKPEGKKDSPDEATLTKKLSKQDRRIGRMTAEKYQMRQTIAQLEEKLSKLKEPDAGDFEGKDYGDLWKAQATHAADKRFIENKASDMKAQLSESDKAWKEERSQILDDNGREAAAVFSDFHDVMKSQQRSFAALPQDIKDVFLEADNGAYALYALAKEEMLIDLADMSPARAAMIVAKMEDKGLALSKAKEVSKAPAPITPLKGTGTGGKSTEQMTGKELLKLLKT